MYDANEFRQRAQQCLQQASDPAMPLNQQRILLQMATKWIALAEDAELIRTLIGQDLPPASPAADQQTKRAVLGPRWRRRSRRGTI
jgi:hypothetical protein